MAGEVQITGKGFLTSAGQLKDKKTLATEDSQSAKKAKNDSSSSSQASDTSVSSALKSVSSRFAKQTNSVINVVNENDANLKTARDNVKAQIATAKELKAAIKDGKDDVAEKKRDALAALQKERDELAQKITQDNKDHLENSKQSIFLGNKNVGEVSISAVKFSKSDDQQNLDDVKGVDALISSLKEDKASIKEQRQDLTDSRKQIESVVGDVRNSLASIEKASISSLQQASQVAQKIAGDVASAGSQAVLATNINETVVKSLLS